LNGGERVRAGLTEEHLVVMGRIALEFGHLEWMVELILEALVGDGAIASIATAGDTFGRRLDKVKRLSESKLEDADQRERLGRWLGHSRKIAEQRNSIFHSAWAAERDTIYFIGGRGRKAEPKAPLRLEELQGFASMVAFHVSEGLAIAKDLVYPQAPKPPDTQ